MYDPINLTHNIADFHLQVLMYGTDRRSCHQTNNTYNTARYQSIAPHPIAGTLRSLDGHVSRGSSAASIVAKLSNVGVPVPTTVVAGESCGWPVYKLYEFSSSGKHQTTNEL